MRPPDPKDAAVLAVIRAAKGAVVTRSQMIDATGVTGREIDAILTRLSLANLIRWESRSWYWVAL